MVRCDHDDRFDKVEQRIDELERFVNRLVAIGLLYVASMALARLLLRR